MPRGGRDQNSGTVIAALAALIPQCPGGGEIGAGQRGPQGRQAKSRNARGRHQNSRGSSDSHPTRIPECLGGRDKTTGRNGTDGRFGSPSRVPRCPPRARSRRWVEVRQHYCFPEDLPGTCRRFCDRRRSHERLFPRRVRPRLELTGPEIRDRVFYRPVEVFKN